MRGIQLLREGQAAQAAAVLERSRCDFCSSLSPHWVRALQSNFLAYRDSLRYTRALECWKETTIAKRQLQLLCSAIKYRAAGGYFPTGVTFLDLGCGDGTQLVECLKYLEQHQSSVPVARVVLVDENRELLTRASNSFKGIGFGSQEILCVHESFSRINLNSLVTEPETWAVLSSSLHEVPYEEKIVLLEQLREKCRFAFVVELFADHDLQPQFSLELSRSVFSLYHGLAAASIGPNEDEYDNYLQNFILPEAFEVLSASYQFRKNYHLTLSQWEKLFQETGWSMNLITATVEAGGFPLSTMVAELS